VTVKVGEFKGLVKVYNEERAKKREEWILIAIEKVQKYIKEVYELQMIGK
jgi:hypothetical protein